MTLQITTRSARYQGNGATTVFPYTFLIPTADDLFVYLYDSTTLVRTLLSPGTYSVTGLGLDTFGDVTYNPVTGPIPGTQWLIIVRTVPYTQDTDIQNQGGFFPEVIEDQLDRIVMQIQQLAEGIGGSLTGQEGDTFQPLPLKADLANKLLGFDAAGEPIGVESIFEEARRIQGDADLQAEIDALMLSNGNLTDSVLAQLRVEDRDLFNPPTVSTPNIAYIVAATATGDWLGHEDDIARWNAADSEWNFYTPVNGYRTWVRDEQRAFVFNGTEWIIEPVSRPSGIDLAHYGLKFNNLASQKSTSTSSLSVSAASKTFVTQSAKAYIAGDYVRASSDSDNTGIYMTGRVVSYSGTSLVVLMTVAVGAGTHADWTIEIDDTPRVQQALNDYPTGGNFSYVGNMKCGQLTYPSYNPYTFNIDGKIYVPEGQWFDVVGRVQIIGYGGGGDIQFGQIRCMAFVGSETSPYVIRGTLAAVRSLKNVIVEPPKFIGIFVDGEDALSALIWFENVGCSARNLATSRPIVINKTFWVYFRKCTFFGSTLNSYSMEFTDDGGAGGGYTGLVYFDDVKLAFKGILVSNTTNTLTPRFYIRDLLSESFGAGIDMITIDMGASAVAVNWEIERCSLEDSNTDCYMFNLIGTGGVRSFNIPAYDIFQSKFIRPTSKPILNLRATGYRQFPYNIAMAPVYPVDNPHAKWSMHFSDGFQGRWISQPRGPSLVPRAPITAVLQDPAAITGGALIGSATATPVRDPWGGLKAFQAGGPNGSIIRVLDAATSVAINDVFLITCLMRSTEAGKLAPRPLLSFDVGSGTAYVIDGIGASVFIGTDDDNRVIDDLGWKWLRTLAFVTTAGSSGSSFLRFGFTRDTSAAIGEYCMPGIIQFPASESWNTQDLIDFAHSIAPFPSGAAAAELAMPLGAKLRVDGGARVFSATAAPSTGAHKVGETVYNSVPTVGQPIGWSCTVAGTPGTWVAWANL